MTTSGKFIQLIRKYRELSMRKYSEEETLVSGTSADLGIGDELGTEELFGKFRVVILDLTAEVPCLADSDWHSHPRSGVKTRTICTEPKTTVRLIRHFHTLTEKRLFQRL